MNYRQIGYRMIGVTAGAALLCAQTPAPSPAPAPGVRVEMQHDVLVGGPAGGPSNFHFIAALPGQAGKTVTGAPYSAEGFTETTQTLSDGTRINRRITRKVARDSQGRTREEGVLPMLGPWAAANEAPKIVTIVDPVAKVIYNLNEKDKTAVRVKLAEPGAFGFQPREGIRVEHREVIVHRTGAASARDDDKFNVMVPPPPMAAVTGAVGLLRAGSEGKEEALGKQTFEGIACEGKRITHTVAAGAIGNDRPLVTTEERWTSTELQVLVRSLTKDPQSGEVNYRLSNISRAEPAKSLFQVPADYTIKDAPAPQIRMMRKGGEPDKE